VSIGLMLLMFVILTLVGLPVGFTIGFSSLLFIVAGDFPVTLMAQRLFVSMDSFALLSLPMFIFAGNLMNISGITDRLWTFSRVLFGRVRGAAGFVSVFTSMIFAAMSGSALATAGGLGPIQFKGMIEDGYNGDDAAAIIASGSTMGPIIPPSIVFVLYGVAAGVSVGRLFLAGVIPGIVMGIAVGSYVFYLIYKNKEQYKIHEKPKGKDYINGLIAGIGPLFAPLIILGGIFSGIFTPTEAATIAALYALVLGIIYKEITFKNFIKCIKDTAKTSAGIMIIIGFAGSFSWVLTSMGASKLFLDFVTGITDSKILILILLNIGLLIVGLFIETNSAVILLTPLMAPAIEALGVDLVHFGMILCVNLLIGILTPPMGMALYVTSNVTKVPFGDIVKKVIPFILVLLIVQLAVTFIPSLSLTLPNLVMGK